MKSNCLTCGIEVSFSPSQKTGKYCSNKCQQKYQQKKVIDDWKKDSNTGVKSGFRLKSGIREYLLEKCNHQCSSCGWNECRVTDDNYPLYIAFHDRNWRNKTLQNMYLLCFNCYFCQIGSLGARFQGISYGQKCRRNRLKREAKEAALRENKNE